MNILYLDEEESFSLTANVTTPGPQRVVLRGYLVSRRADGTYVAPLIPQLFFGVAGTQLTSWRQNIPTAGSQVILSRGAGGYPKVPREQLYWRKVAEPEREEVEVAEVPTVVEPIPINWQTVAVVIGGVFLLYVLTRK